MHTNAANKNSRSSGVHVTAVGLGRRRDRVVALLGDAQVFLSLRKVGMETQRRFELHDRLGHVAFGHDDLTEIVMWLGELWVDVGRALKMAFCFGQLASPDRHPP